MAQLFPDHIVNSPALSPLSQALCRILEQNLSDEWECHAVADGPEISHFMVVSPDLGFLTLLISKCTPEQFDSFFQSIPELQQACLDATRHELQKHKQLCDKSGTIDFPVGFGIIFPELTSSEININIGALAQFSIFADELDEIDTDYNELENILFGMVKDVNFEELEEEKLEVIKGAVPDIFIALQIPNTELNMNMSTLNILQFRLQQAINYFKLIDGKNKIQGNRGIEYFVNHLQFLGYKCWRSTTEDVISYLCDHPNKVQLLLFTKKDLGILFLQISWEVHGIDFDNENNRKDILEVINNFNSSSVIACFLDEDNKIIYQAIFPDIYFKIDFGRFLEIYNSKFEECYRIISSLYKTVQVNDFK